jgi:tRNA U54 and U55 pseudouridine synthase Pus10
MTLLSRLEKLEQAATGADRPDHFVTYTVRCGEVCIQSAHITVFGPGAAHNRSAPQTPQPHR